MLAKVLNTAKFRAGATDLERLSAKIGIDWKKAVYVQFVIQYLLEALFTGYC